MWMKTVDSRVEDGIRKLEMEEVQQDQALKYGMMTNVVERRNSLACEQ